VRVREAEEMLPPIQLGELDTLVIEASAGGRQVYTLPGADEPFRSPI